MVISNLIAIFAENTSTMSQFIDYGNSDFRSVKNSNFIDKSGLLNILNKNMDTDNRFICISRPRRFGKSVAAQMAYAY